MKIKYLICAILLIFLVSSNLVLSDINLEEALSGSGKKDPHNKDKHKDPHKTPKPTSTSTPTKTPKPTCPPIDCPPGQGPIKIGTSDCDYLCTSDACKNVVCTLEIRICKENESPKGCCPCRH